MKTTQKGFTLVELIVVITILAILGTIAFISLQGYSQDAKNSKVVSDVRSLASAVESKLSEGSISLRNLVASTDNNNMVAAFTWGLGGTYKSGILLWSGSASHYDAGFINYITLEQNGNEFGTGTYKIGILTNTADGNTDRMYQIVGATGPIDAFRAEVRGNYIFAAGDETGLISHRGVGDNVGLKQGDAIPNNEATTPVTPDL